VEMNAVDRLVEYGALEAEEEEAAPVRMEREAMAPTPQWPQQGAIEFDNLVFKYRPQDAAVLHGLSCRIRPREKIGIVGRTGAGKSSLTLALFRIAEASSGRILIDDVDIAAMGLYDLRSKLTIIPQDPVLFMGTIRSNLDPFDQCTDRELWTHLARLHLKETVANLPGQLSHRVVENGENFSVGQRQLLCLARALVRKSKIVIMDEASASLDFKTDQLIREFVRTEFADCTVLTIAHRIHTVIESDRIMVLDAGRIVEFDRPNILLSNPDSMFSSLVRDANINCNNNANDNNSKKNKTHKLQAAALAATAQ